MPKSLPSPSYPILELRPFILQKEKHQAIAESLGMPWLPPAAVDFIEYEIAFYKWMIATPDITTLGADIAAIDAVLKAEKELERLFSSGPTLSSSRLSKKHSTGFPLAMHHRLFGGQIRAVMEPRLKQLTSHPRVDPRTKKRSVICAGCGFFIGLCSVMMAASGEQIFMLSLFLCSRRRASIVNPTFIIPVDLMT
jgi:hypothetical protein